MKKHEQYGSAPILFLDESKREEWENLDSSVRKNVFSLLHTVADQMENKICIEMLCNVIIDLDKRIQELEKKNGMD